MRETLSHCGFVHAAARVIRTSRRVRMYSSSASISAIKKNERISFGREGTYNRTSFLWQRHIRLC